VRVLVAGASGFAGALAARLVDRHPHFELGPVTSRSDAGRPLRDLYPQHRVDRVLEELDLETHAAQADAAIVAYPHGASAPVVAALRERGLQVVDLSADFRLRDVATYEHWYGVQHPAPDLIADAVYGLPERHRDALRGAGLVAGPGCFPTAAILALAPLGGTIRDAVVDAKTGVSGAGRAATPRTHFVAVDENVAAYGVGHHRHMPEIDQEVDAARPITFTPHLLPLDQGELVSCYVDTDAGDVLERYRAAYADEPFVELLDRPPGVREVRETNFCAIHVTEDARTGKAFVFAAIDNLWKGTASQAVQCLNLMAGRPETEGLL
jgi:N-acetyl-gamma-glutamyl-phosphate reductase